MTPIAIVVCGLEARTVLVPTTGTNVEFNPAVVKRYRLLGYENRDVAAEDFHNDAVDAGKVGAGHRIAARCWG